MEQVRPQRDTSTVVRARSRQRGNTMPVWHLGVRYRPGPGELVSRAGFVALARQLGHIPRFVLADERDVARSVFAVHRLAGVHDEEHAGRWIEAAHFETVEAPPADGLVLGGAVETEGHLVAWLVDAEAPHQFERE